MARRPAPPADETPKTELYLRPPRGSGGFALIRRTRAKLGDKSTNETLSSEVLDSINEQLRRGRLTLDEAREAARREVRRLRDLAAGGRRRQPELGGANLKLLEKYWVSTYEHRDLVDPDSAWNRLRRAVEVLGDTHLTASREELQTALDRELRGQESRHRDAASALNQILKWMGRTDVKMRRAKKPISEVRFLTLEEMRIVSAQIEDPATRTLVRAGFASGCRTGELFGADPRHFRPESKTQYIPDQIKRNGKRAKTKNRVQRPVPLIPDCVDWWREWLAISVEKKREMRGRRHAEALRAACKKAYPEQPEKWLTMHNTRDSYAVHLLVGGVPIAMVAQALGDSVKVVEAHYTGFTLTPGGLAEVHSILEKRQKPG